MIVLLLGAALAYRCVLAWRAPITNWTHIPLHCARCAIDGRECVHAMYALPQWKPFDRQCKEDALMKQ
jgi:hypothetical protein